MLKYSHYYYIYFWYQQGLTNILEEAATKYDQSSEKKNTQENARYKMEGKIFVLVSITQIISIADISFLSLYSKSN